MISFKMWDDNIFEKMRMEKLGKGQDFWGRFFFRVHNQVFDRGNNTNDSPYKSHAQHVK